MANYGSIPKQIELPFERVKSYPRGCICITWHDDKGIFSHNHYFECDKSDITKILNRKEEKEHTARSTHMTITETVDPCVIQANSGRRSHG